MVFEWGMQNLQHGRRVERVCETHHAQVLLTVSPLSPPSSYTLGSPLVFLDHLSWNPLLSQLPTIAMQPHNFSTAQDPSKLV